MARQYREKVETELREICNDVLALLDKETDHIVSHLKFVCNCDKNWILRQIYCTILNIIFCIEGV